MLRLVRILEHIFDGADLCLVLAADPSIVTFTADSQLLIFELVTVHFSYWTSQVSLVR